MTYMVITRLSGHHFYNRQNAGKVPKLKAQWIAVISDSLSVSGCGGRTAFMPCSKANSDSNIYDFISPTANEVVYIAVTVAHSARSHDPWYCMLNWNANFPVPNS